MRAGVGWSDGGRRGRERAPAARYDAGAGSSQDAATDGSPPPPSTPPPSNGGSTPDGGGSVPAYCAAGGSQLWNNLEACGWPGPGNTGPTGALTARSDVTISGSGTYSDMDIHGNLDHANGVGVSDPRSESALSLAAGLRASVSVAVAPSLRVRAHVEADAPVGRATLRVAGADAWTSPAVAPSIGLGVTTYFP